MAMARDASVVVVAAGAGGTVMMVKAGRTSPVGPAAVVKASFKAKAKVKVKVKARAKAKVKARVRIRVKDRAKVRLNLKAVRRIAAGGVAAGSARAVMGVAVAARRGAVDTAAVVEVEAVAGRVVGVVRRLKAGRALPDRLRPLLRQRPHRRLTWFRRRHRSERCTPRSSG